MYVRNCTDIKTGSFSTSSSRNSIVSTYSTFNLSEICYVKKVVSIISAVRIVKEAKCYIHVCTRTYLKEY